MDLKNFSNTDDSAGYRDQDDLHEQATETKQESKMSEQDIREAVSRYSKFSSDELMMELMKQVSFQKDKGNTDSMKNTIEKIKPFLNAEQQKRLEVIIQQMKL